MYFWNKDKLNQDLVKGLPESENIKYLTIFILFVASLPLLTMSDEPSKYLVFENVFMIIFALVELFILYKINLGSKGLDFLSRYMAIGFVAAIRFLVITIIPLIIVSAITFGFIYGENIPDEGGIEEPIILSIWSLGYLYLQIKYWKQLIKLERESKTVEL